MNNYDEKPLLSHFFKKGVHPPYNKNTASLQSVIMPPPARVIIPMSMHIGAPAVPVVAKGDYVKVGQVIGEAKGFVSSPVHASVSGTVAEISEVVLPAGNTVQAIVIDSDGQMTAVETEPPKCDTIAELIGVVQQSGLVGLGGAGFPTHVKLSVPEGKKADTLIINAAECEPFITADHREMLENSYQILSGLYTLKEILGIHRVLIAIESNKPDAIETLTKIAANREADPDNEVRVIKLEATYPRGAEKVLITCCTGREVPIGGLPIDAGCIVMNISSVAFFANYIKTGMPLVTKRITVDGGAVAEPKNVIVPIGTPIADVIAFCGGYKCPPAKLLYGGPMMGLALRDDSLPILKQTNAIIALDAQQAKAYEPTACIRCGKCIDACPMELMPVTLALASDKKDIETLKKYDLMNCIECGSCSFSCPAHRRILQSIRLGKAALKAATPPKK